MGKKSNYITIPLPPDTQPTHPGGGRVASAVPKRNGVELSCLGSFCTGAFGNGTLPGAASVLVPEIGAWMLQCCEGPRWGKGESPIFSIPNGKALSMEPSITSPSASGEGDGWLDQILSWVAFQT